MRGEGGDKRRRKEERERERDVEVSGLLLLCSPFFPASNEGPSSPFVPLSSCLFFLALPFFFLRRHLREPRSPTRCAASPFLSASIEALWSVLDLAPERCENASEQGAEKSAPLRLKAESAPIAARFFSFFFRLFAARQKTHSRIALPALLPLSASNGMSRRLLFHKTTVPRTRGPGTCPCRGPWQPRA